MSRDAPPPLPGGYKMGEKVFYTAEDHTFLSGNTLLHGQQGEVIGPGTGDYEGKGVYVLFPGNAADVICTLDEVRCMPPRRLRCHPLSAPHTVPTPQLQLQAQPRAP